MASSVKAAAKSAQVPCLAHIPPLVGGIATPLKHMNVNWDDDIPNIWKNKSHVPNHQPAPLLARHVLLLFLLSFVFSVFLLSFTHPGGFRRITY